MVTSIFPTKRINSLNTGMVIGKLRLNIELTTFYILQYKMVSDSYKRLKDMSNDKVDKYEELLPEYDFLNAMNFLVFVFILLLVLYLL